MGCHISAFFFFLNFLKPVSVFFLDFWPCYLLIPAPSWWVTIWKTNKCFVGSKNDSHRFFCYLLIDIMIIIFFGLSLYSSPLSTVYLSSFFGLWSIPGNPLSSAGQAGSEARLQILPNWAWMQRQQRTLAKLAHASQSVGNDSLMPNTRSL